VIFEPLAPVLRLLADAIRRARLAYYRWARHDMQRRNPCHPDLPYVIRRISALESQS